MSLQLTPGEYVDKGGAVCPMCQGHEIEGGSYDTFGDELLQEVWCLDPDCEYKWVDTYQLTGYKGA